MRRLLRLSLALVGRRFRLLSLDVGGTLDPTSARALGRTLSAARRPLRAVLNTGYPRFEEVYHRVLRHMPPGARRAVDVWLRNGEVEIIDVPGFIAELTAAGAVDEAFMARRAAVYAPWTAAERRALRQLVEELSGPGQPLCRDGDAWDLLRVHPDDAVRCQQVVAARLARAGLSGSVVILRENQENPGVIRLAISRRTKAAAVLGAAARYGVDPSEVLHIGDDTNDFPAFMAAGGAIYVGRGRPAAPLSPGTVLLGGGPRGTAAALCALRGLGCLR